MAYTRLSLVEREQLYAEYRAGLTCVAIAQKLGRSASTISRELSRNRAEYMRGAPEDAHKASQVRARTLHREPLRIPSSPALQDYIHNKLRLRWSPRQISKAMREELPPDQWVSHETIYQYIYVQAKGELKKELIRYLREARPKRKPRVRGADKRGQIPDMISIHQRPPEVADRSVPGHWEGDLIIGADHKSALITLVERTTRYVLILRLEDNYRADTVRKAIEYQLQSLPLALIKSLTWDRGKEMAEHKLLRMATGVTVYFCDPHSPWQRGTNENTNRLVRGFLPKGTDFRAVSNDYIQFVQDALNQRPRETLGWKTPEFAFANLLNHFSA